MTFESFVDGRSKPPTRKLPDRHLLSVEQIVAQLAKLGAVPSGGAGALKKDLAKFKNIHLVEYRYKNDFSQDVASEKAGISKGIWSGLENKSRVPTDTEAEKVCSVLSRPVELVFEKIRDTLPNQRMSFKSDSKLALLRLLDGYSRDDLTGYVVDDLGAGSSEERKHLERQVKSLIKKIETGQPLPEKDLYIIENIAEIFNLSTIDILGKEGI